MIAYLDRTYNTGQLQTADQKSGSLKLTRTALNLRDPLHIGELEIGSPTKVKKRKVKKKVIEIARADSCVVSSCLLSRCHSKFFSSVGVESLSRSDFWPIYLIYCHCSSALHFSLCASFSAQILFILSLVVSLHVVGY